jgi:glycosyltransferase involved in cell wall biosynthesis
MSFLEQIAGRWEIIIVEDGSPDATGAVADEYARRFPQVIRVIHHQKNLGYGVTIRDGFRAARYPLVMYTDGDYQYDIEEFRPHLRQLDAFDILSGYAPQKAVTFRRRVQSWCYNAMLVLLFGTFWRDANCSMKLFKRKVLESMPINSTSAFIDAEMLIRARRNGFRICQFPVTHYPRRTGLASGSTFHVISSTIRDMLLFRFGFL